MTFFAHTRVSCGPDQWDELTGHLERTGALAAEFARSYAPVAARAAGLWHDLGKFRPEFQEYLHASRNDDAGVQDEGWEGPRRHGPKHAIVGAYHAYERHKRWDLGIAIAAHHGGLPDKSDFDHRVEEGRTIVCKIPEVFCRSHAIERLPGDGGALWIRFVFSALVDADSLTTEAWHTGKSRPRCDSSMADLRSRLEAHLAKLGQKEEATSINQIRREIQQDCRERAAAPMGAFRLTVPTGGGKTLASLLFALRHAEIHGLRRVIVVIPYTSIIEQTAKVYQEIFGRDAVLEHHSSLDPSEESILSRLVTENWDSPIVVTTSVRFFETLHSNHKRDLRRLHNIAESVVVMDEVQTFPLELVKPIKDVLDRLNKLFRVTTVHCSATQPLLVQEHAAEIVQDHSRHFAQLRSRVQVKWDVKEAVTWEALAEKIRAHAEKQVLTIVHSRADAITLARAVGEDCLHLSTLLCAAHRKEVIAQIKQRLKRRVPCLVVSTQVVEAGVDIDFPIVYRALAGMDSLAQAAGRCNRNGSPTTGTFHIFLAPSEPPRGVLREGFKIMVKRSGVDIFEPRYYAEYFRELDFRQRRPSPIPQLERAYELQRVAQEFRMIPDDEGTPVIAPYGAWEAAVRRCREQPSREAFRALQPYSVNVRRDVLAKLQATGGLLPLIPTTDTAWVVLPNHVAIYSGRFGFGGDNSDDLLFHQV